MRRIVVTLTLALAATGLLLVDWTGLSSQQGVGRALSLAHIWGGVFFLVVFPLYASDHIWANRRWLRRLRLVTASGVVQALAGFLLMPTGIVVLLYGEVVWAFVRDTHHWLTYPLLAALLAHWLAPKHWRTPKAQREQQRRKK